MVGRALARGTCRLLLAASRWAAKYVPVAPVLISRVQVEPDAVTNRLRTASRAQRQARGHDGGSACGWGHVPAARARVHAQCQASTLCSWRSGIVRHVGAVTYYSNYAAPSPCKGCRASTLCVRSTASRVRDSVSTSPSHRPPSWKTSTGSSGPVRTALPQYLTSAA
jgi:hypothetical protein